MLFEPAGLIHVIDLGAAGHPGHLLVGRRQGRRSPIDDLLDGAGGDRQSQHRGAQALHVRPAHGLDAAELGDKGAQPRPVACLYLHRQLRLDAFAAARALALVEHVAGDVQLDRRQLDVLMGVKRVQRLAVEVPAPAGAALGQQVFHPARLQCLLLMALVFLLASFGALAFRPLALRALERAVG